MYTNVRLFSVGEFAYISTQLFLSFNGNFPVL